MNISEACKNPYYNQLLNLISSWNTHWNLIFKMSHPHQQLAPRRQRKRSQSQLYLRSVVNTVQRDRAAPASHLWVHRLLVRAVAARFCRPLRRKRVSVAESCDPTSDAGAYARLGERRGRIVAPTVCPWRPAGLVAPLLLVMSLELAITQRTLWNKRG